jgi:acetyltransferase-like isoleucine patch superfamily enzyme
MSTTVDIKAAESLLLGCPAVAGNSFLGSSGFRLPNFSALEEYSCDIKEEVQELKRFGLFIDSQGKRNSILFDPYSPSKHINIQFGSSDNNKVIISPKARLASRMRFEGNRNVFYSGDHSKRNESNFVFRGDDNLIYYGEECSSNGLDCFVEGPANYIAIGYDAMFAHGVNVRTSDSHGIVDLTTGELLNKPKSILVGPHVWFGTLSLLLKGVSVGHGAVVAARAVVTKDVPVCAIVAGAPAKTVRTNASWTRSAYPSGEEISKLKNEIAGWSQGDQ